MEVRAVAKYVRVQPRKVRIIADEVRGKSALYTASLLRYHPSKSAKALRKVLVSAMANAMENHNLAPESLKIHTITVDEGPKMKRLQARAMGRGFRIIKKTSHITVVVSELDAVARVKPHGSKEKPRPTFAAPVKKSASTKKAKATEEVAPVEEPVAEEVKAPVEPEVTAEAGQPEEATAVSESEAPEEAAAEKTVEDAGETTAEAEGADEAPATEEEAK